MIAMLEISLSNLFLFNKRCTLGPSRNQLRDIQTPPKSGMLYRSKGLCTISILTRWIKQWILVLFSAVNLATEKVKNWNLSMEDFKQLKDAGVNSIWKWKYFINCVGYWSNEAFKCYCGSFFIFIIIIFYSLRAFAVERRKLRVNK